MIAVIADDFTGAAEIGGIGLRHGFKVIIETEVTNHPETDLLVIAANTRSLDAIEASKKIKTISEALIRLKPGLIYKKIDSVLRGNILSELKTQMNITGKQKSIVIAANPHFKRIIHNGIYYINGIPLHETGFATDPEYPVHTPDVKKLVGNNSIPVYASLRPNDVLPEQGLIIGDVNSIEDLTYWVSKIDKNTLPAGASGFFDTILEKIKPASSCSMPCGHLTGERALFVLGSIYPKGNDFFKMVRDKNYYLSNMPYDIYYNKKTDLTSLSDWANEIAFAIDKHKKVVVSVNHIPSDEANITCRIKDIIGQMLSMVIKKTTLDELIIEGGSTTATTLEYLNIHKLYPFQVFDIGIIRMKNEVYPNMYITTKPGSYLWPPDVWKEHNLEVFNKITTN